jgi:anti-sigma B factor antagonist
VSADAHPVLWIGQAAVVTLPVEVDITNADQVREDLLSVVNQGTALLVADMSKTTFCDSAGVGALVRAFRRAQASDCSMRLVVRTVAVQRVLAITGVDRLLDIYPSVAASLPAHHGHSARSEAPQPENVTAQADTDDGGTERLASPPG